MDNYHERVEDLVYAFKTRIPGKYWEGFTDRMNGGEYAMAIDLLIAAIDECGMPVSTDEQTELDALTTYVKPRARHTPKT